MTKPISKIYSRRWTPKEEERIELLQMLYGKKWTSHLAAAFPARSNGSIRKKWYDVSKQLWTVDDDKILVDIVNGTHFKTSADMKVWWEAACVSIANKSANQCVDHWFSLLCPSQEKLRWETRDDTKLLVLCSRYGNKWSKIAQYFPRRSHSTIRKRWQVIDKIKRSGDTNKSAYENIKETAAALLNLCFESKLLLQESNDTQGLHPKRSIPTKMSTKEKGENKSKLRIKGEVDDVALPEVEDNGICPPKAMHWTESPPIEIPLLLDLSDEDIETFMKLPHKISDTSYTWNALSI